jgi:hypothetical protein
LNFEFGNVASGTWSEDIHFYKCTLNEYYYFTGIIQGSAVGGSTKSGKIKYQKRHTEALVTNIFFHF